MAYSDVNAVRDLLGKFTLSGSTKPTEQQATALLDQVSAEIDTTIAGAGYTVPVTAPAYFLTRLSLLNSVGAAAAILRAMFPDATGAGETPAYAFWWNWYQTGLKSLANGSAIPPDVITNAAYVAPSTYFTNNPDVEVDLGDIAEPRFKMGTVF